MFLLRAHTEKSQIHEVAFTLSRNRIQVVPFRPQNPTIHFTCVKMPEHHWLSEVAISYEAGIQGNRKTFECVVCLPHYLRALPEAIKANTQHTIQCLKYSSFQQLIAISKIYLLSRAMVKWHLKILALLLNRETLTKEPERDKPIQRILTSILLSSCLNVVNNRCYIRTLHEPLCIQRYGRKNNIKHIFKQKNIVHSIRAVSFARVYISKDLVWFSSAISTFRLRA